MVAQNQVPASFLIPALIALHLLWVEQLWVSLGICWSPAPESQASSLVKPGMEVESSQGISAHLASWRKLDLQKAGDPGLRAVPALLKVALRGPPTPKNLWWAMMIHRLSLSFPYEQEDTSFIRRGTQGGNLIPCHGYCSWLARFNVWKQKFPKP